MLSVKQTKYTSHDLDTGSYVVFEEHKLHKRRKFKLTLRKLLFQDEDDLQQNGAWLVYEISETKPQR